MRSLVALPPCIGPHRSDFATTERALRYASLGRLWLLLLRVILSIVPTRAGGSRQVAYALPVGPPPASERARLRSVRPPEIVLPQVLFRYTNARAPSNILSSVLACASPKGFHQVCSQSTKRAIQNSDRSIDITIVIYSGINNGENSSDITSKDVTRYPYFPRATPR